MRVYYWVISVCPNEQNKTKIYAEILNAECQVQRRWRELEQPPKVKVRDAVEYLLVNFARCLGYFLLSSVQKLRHLEEALHDKM